VGTDSVGVDHQSHILTECPRQPRCGLRWSVTSADRDHEQQFASNADACVSPIERELDQLACEQAPSALLAAQAHEDVHENLDLVAGYRAAFGHDVPMVVHEQPRGKSTRNCCHGNSIEAHSSSVQAIAIGSAKTSSRRSVPG
jgi:hypothetical protein